MGEDEGEKVKLGLGIGVDCNYNDRHQNGDDKKKKKEFGGGGGGRLFSAAQLLELEHQALIYRHLAAALPVPFHLLLPIWNSVAASLGPANADSLYKHFPTFVGFSPLGFDYRHQMDPEPGRCRRTDGKKWRCSRNVVPDQKYCEQHMHRGRQRSRKHVENSQMASPSTTTKAPKNSEGELGNSSTNLQISTPKILQLTAQSSVNTSIIHATTIKSATPTWITNLPANGTSTAARPTAPTNGVTHENDLNVSLQDSSRNHAGDNCMIRGSNNNRNNFNVGSNISPGLGFSPKSVLQARQMTFLGCNGLYFDNRSSIELEPGRCRRTDGKKWRCKRDVVPNQKYCCMHVHRGAKRQRKDSQPVAVPSTSAAAMNSVSHLSQTTPVPRKADCATPNTNLSMSLPASPPRIQSDEKIVSISDSDTTITDTSLPAYDSGYVSS